MRWLPMLMALGLLLLAVSFFVRVWPLEFIASFTPQLIILCFTVLLMYATIATQNLVVLSLDGYMEVFGRISIGSFAFSILLLAGVSSFSSNILTPATFSARIRDDPKNITVGTFNKLYSSNELKRDATFISAVKADVMSIQEINEFEVIDLARSLNHNFSYITDCNCSAGDTEVAVISRYPILNATQLYENDNSVIVRAVIDSPAHGQFVVYAVHMFIPYELDSYGMREEAFKLLSDAVNAETLPVFAMGDFNTTIYSPDLRKFMANTPAIENIVSRAWPQCSWSHPGKQDLGAVCARIDYVFVPAGSLIQGHSIGVEGYSDHRPVVVELMLN